MQSFFRDLYGRRKRTTERMTKYYEDFRPLIFAAAMSGLYFSPIEKLVEKKWLLLFFKTLPAIPFTCMLIFFGGQLKYLFYDEGDITKKLYSTANLSFTLLSLFSIFSFYNGRKDFVRLWEWWDETFLDDPFPEDREDILRKSNAGGMKLMKILMTGTVIILLGHNTITFFKRNKELGRPSGIPYAHRSPDFELIATLDMIVGLFGFLALQTHEALIMVFLSLEDAQLLHLKKSLGRILGAVTVDDSGETMFNVSDGEDDEIISDSRKREIFRQTDRKIRTWINHHQKTLWFHGEVQKIFVSSIAVKGFIFIYAFCMDLFLSVTKGFSMRTALLIVFFCLTNYLIYYINVKYADSIAETGRTLFDEAFEGSWNSYPTHMKTTFCLIATQTCRNVRFVMVKIYPFNSITFVKVLSSGYTFLTFLLHVFN